VAPVTAIAISSDGKRLAVARYGSIALFQRTGSRQAPAWKPERELTGLPGKVESVHFCSQGTRLLSASGVTGSGGIATLWDVQNGEQIRSLPGHRDVIFDAEISPDEQVIATCSYDREIHLWSVDTGKLLRTLSGHNGAVYDIAFSPDGKTLASASADDTCKLWRISDGERLDTLGQPLKEQYAITFTPDQQFVIAGGADNRIRFWNLKFGDRPGINPLVIARFAHEAPVTTLCLSPDGTRLISAAEDRTLKVWSTANLTEDQLLTGQSDVVETVVFVPGEDRFIVGRLDGSWEELPLPAVRSQAAATVSTETPEPTAPSQAMAQSIGEVEPNDQFSQAGVLSLPAKVTGTIFSPASGSDVDYFRFPARAGETWIVQVDTPRGKSQLDSYVEVLTAAGQPIERAMLQAVRDSYFTFRGKNSSQSDDFRVFNWEEMEVNQFLYSNGEVVKLWRTPRGPDSGFDVYPGSKMRWNYFDTSGLSHAMGEPCYVVEAHPPGTELIPNGLPVFRVYYANDDDPRRDNGSDSKLMFTAPADGDYLIAVRDVRGMEQADFTYTLSVRAPAPDFKVALSNRKPQLIPGNRREIRFIASRIDQFDGPITITATGLPNGYDFDGPLLIETENLEALGVLSLASETAAPTPEQVRQIRFVATAEINGQTISHEIPGFETITFDKDPGYQLTIRPTPGGAKPLPSTSGALEFEIDPGETIQLEVVADRQGFKEIIEFGKADSGRNLPHGVYVDNIGLNGLMLLPGQTVRTFFITASRWTPAQTRPFHLQASGKNGTATQPVILHVRKPNSGTRGQQAATK
jgi:hypothetical protein